MSEQRYWVECKCCHKMRLVTPPVRLSRIADWALTFTCAICAAIFKRKG